MSLREDIEKEYDVYVYLPDDLPDIINKVLDAAIEAGRDNPVPLGYGIPEIKAYIQAVNDVFKAINKLRGE